MSSNGIDVYASASLRRLDFPRFGFPTRSTYSGWRVDNPYQELGLLGRIVVQDITGSQCLVSLEVAGDPEDPTTDRRLAVFEPVAKELVRRLELHSGRIELFAASPTENDHKIRSFLSTIYVDQDDRLFLQGG